MTVLRPRTSLRRLSWRAWQNLDVLSDPAKFAPWLRRIVFGASIDWLRVFRPDFFRLADAGTDLELSAQPAHTESALQRLEAIELGLMYEGPAPAGLSAEAWRDARARFMAEAGYATLEEAQHYLKSCDDALAAFRQHEEVVIWLDYRLSDQLILIRALDWFSRQNLDAQKLSLICVGRFPGRGRFVGLGELTADQLASLADTRLRVTDAQLRLAQAAWHAFTSRDPTAIERLLETDTSALPFIAAALRRHLKQFPSIDGGLSRTERQALSVLRERGALAQRRLFAAVQQLEEQIFMGDGSFYRILRELASARHPLVYIAQAEVTLTQAGRNVLEGRADHILLNGIHRWLGGVHLEGDEAAWRWDRVSARIVRLGRPHH